MPGNPNPSPATRFKPGDEWAGNGKGKTKGQRAAEIRAAESAALLRDLALSELLEKVQSGEMTPMQAITADNLRLFKDSEDRAHGTPKQAVDMSALLTFNPTIAGDDRDL
jgi:hypothetical protein